MLGQGLRNRALHLDNAPEVGPTPIPRICINDNQISTSYFMAVSDFAQKEDFITHGLW